MTKRFVKTLRVRRIPCTEATVVDFDGVAFTLDYDHLVQMLTDGAECLKGIHINRKGQPKPPESA